MRNHGHYEEQMRLPEKYLREIFASVPVQTKHELYKLLNDMDVGQSINMHRLLGQVVRTDKHNPLKRVFNVEIREHRKKETFFFCYGIADESFCY